MIDMHIRTVVRLIINRSNLIKTVMLLALVGWVGIADALMIEISNEDLVKRADCAIVGKVSAVKSFEQSAKNIFTLAVIEVGEVVFGQITNCIITIQYRGGAVNCKGQFVEDEPMLSSGKKVVLFLNLIKEERWTEANADAFTKGPRCRVTGRSQGMYEVAPDDTVTTRSWGVKNLSELVQKIRVMAQKVRNTENVSEGSNK